MSKLATGAAIISEWLGEGGVPVPREQAQARANVCLNVRWHDADGKEQVGCPNNARRTLWESLERPVAELIRALMQLKSGMNMRVQGEKSLGSCKVCLCHLPLLVHTPTELFASDMSDAEATEYPEYCWKRSEFESWNKSH